MKSASVRDLHLNTSRILKEVSEGEQFVIQKRGVPVAELRPFRPLERTQSLPDREAFLQSLPFVRTGSGRILEEDRS